MDGLTPERNATYERIKKLREEIGPLDLSDDEGYTIRLHPAEEGGYVVTCDEVPGAVTQGEDVREALEMMADAMTVMLEENV